MPSFFDEGLYEEVRERNRLVLTHRELEICKLLDAKWVTREEGFPKTVMLWDKKPHCEMYGHEKSYEGEIAIADIAPDKFPSLNPGDCIFVADICDKEK